ncbi:hypothetical protein [Actinoplanes aureus]|uniref:Uncharacterized protein n=1 Tax=Actinoplanes aureus TaxID=2792083 RepID=A0A931C6K7_9ACTN|nr:hypothetical protein [Actinoplanes aureus]MBG0562322.1 hypothetical protein [Actinoplanes aureus]
MSPTNVTPRDGIGRPQTSVERRPFGPTIAEPADALRTSAGLGPIEPVVLRPAVPEPGQDGASEG